MQEPRHRAPGRPRLVVSLATYNERDNVGPLVEAIRAAAPGAHVLVIDDNSPDGTGAAADALADAHPGEVSVVHRPSKLGLGTALLRAMRFSMDGDYDLLLNMDADFSHPPRYLPAVLAGMSRYDVMIGSRYVPGGATENWPLERRVLSFGVNFLVRLTLLMPVRDASGAFRCYRVSMLRRTDLSNLLSRGYSFQQEVLYRCHLAGCRLGETPILFENRRSGYSKVSAWESLRSISIILYLGLQSLLGLDRRAKITAVPDLRFTW